MASVSKKKRVDLTIAQRKQIADMRVGGAFEKLKTIANLYGIDKTTVSKICHRKDEVNEQYHEKSVSADEKRSRRMRMPDLDKALLLWFDNMRKNYAGKADG